VQVLLVCKPDARVFLLTQELLERLGAQGIAATVTGHRDMSKYSGFGYAAVLVLGGDGTILSAARHFAASGIPVMGVNFGKVGFLASTEVEHAVTALDMIIHGEYRVEERMMLEIAVVRDNRIIRQATALNDAVIRAAYCHTTCIHLTVNGHSYGRHRGDGVICATPTGSTGYSLSAGGPVVDPLLHSIIVTPINPQLSLSHTLILAACCRLVLRIDGDQVTRLYLDGEEVLVLEKVDGVEIASARQRARIIQFADLNHFTKLGQLSTDQGFRIGIH